MWIDPKDHSVSQNNYRIVFRIFKILITPEVSLLIAKSKLYISNIVRQIQKVMNKDKAAIEIEKEDTTK